MDQGSLLYKLLESYGTNIQHPGKWWLHAKLRKLLKVNINADFEVVRAGLKWRLNPSNFVESDVFWLGCKDTWNLYHVLRLLKPGSIAFDIGANFGYYSCKLASGPDNCTVYAFEPFPPTHERLTANIALNHLGNSIHAFKMGLSDAEGQAFMETLPGNTGGAHVTEKNGTAITLTTLDHFCGKEGITRVDFMKIDVEGFEASVLRGGEKTIRCNKPAILIELNPQTLRRAGLLVRDVAEIINGFGYRLFTTRRNRLEMLKHFPINDDYIDVFCLHPEVHTV